MNFLKYAICLLLVLLTVHSVGEVEAQPAPPESLTIPPLRVATREAAPFSYKVNGEWTGIAIELWKEIAKEMGREFSIQELSLKQIFEKLERGELDVAVGAISMTSDREASIDFSHAFFGTGLGIATRYNSDNSWSGLIGRFYSSEFLKAIGALILALFVAAFLVYLFERKKNAEEFGGTIPSGLGASFWWSAVTMTTVGYGDKAPKTIGGRIVGGLWMFTSVVIVSTFTASIASSLTVTRLVDNVRGPEDLAGVGVVTVTNSTSSRFLREQGIRHSQVDTIGEALERLENSKVNAVVYDRPVLRYLIGKNPDPTLMVLGHSLMRENYAFALRPNFPLREQINRHLLRITQSDSFRRSVSRYLGGNN